MRKTAMREYKVGERIVIEVVEGNKCEERFFATSTGACIAYSNYPCAARSRKDHKNVIYKQVE